MYPCEKAICLCLAVLLTLQCLAPCEAARDRKRGNRKKGKRQQGNKKTFFVSPTFSCDGCGGNKKCFGPGNSGPGDGHTASPMEQFQQSEVEDTVHAAVQHLKAVINSVRALTKINPVPPTSEEKGIKELNPTTKLALHSDSKFKMLGQATLFSTWMMASLQFVAEKEKTLSGGNHLVHSDHSANLTSTQVYAHDLLTTLAVLRDQLGFQENKVRKSKSPLSCQRVRVTRMCTRKVKNCTKERLRSLVILRDVLRAAEKMLAVFETCHVQAHRDGFTLDCMDDDVFYKCVRWDCDLQKSTRCKQCLNWE